MTKFKKTFPFVLDFIFLYIVFWLSDHMVFGQTYNRFFPCKQPMGYSAPCYLGVDLTVLFISAIATIISIIIKLKKISKK
jgi:hypothetical protein